MKKFFVNVFATTGISIIILAIIALLFQGKYICVETLFQVSGANLVVHIGLIVLRRLELKYAIIEMFLHIALLIITLVVFGSVFSWFNSTPIWVLVIMGFAIYIISAVLNLFCMKQEAQELNALIKKRNSIT